MEDPEARLPMLTTAPHGRWLISLAFVLTAAGCGSDVVVGVFFDSVGTDAGSFDAGLVDAGLVDAGSFDAGSFDAGPFDAGSFDAGPFDAGPFDAGSFDAGPFDAGPFDAGSFDAGPADLELSPLAPWLGDVGGTPTVQLRVRNLGPGSAANVSAAVVLPPDASFVPSAGCVVDGGVITCALGTLDVDAGALVSVTIAPSYSPRWVDLIASVSTSTAEVQLTNNQLEVAGAVTPTTTAAPFTVTQRDTLVIACFGVQITSFSQCVPGSRLFEVFGFYADGGIADDGGLPGYWVQSAHRRNLAFRFGTFGEPTVYGGFVGTSVDGGCFEGIIDRQGRPNAGAWRVCF